jgi:hypothetical protein
LVAWLLGCLWSKSYLLPIDFSPVQKPIPGKMAPYSTALSQPCSQFSGFVTFPSPDRQHPRQCQIRPAGTVQILGAFLVRVGKLLFREAFSHIYQPCF